MDTEAIVIAPKIVLLELDLKYQAKLIIGLQAVLEGGEFYRKVRKVDKKRRVDKLVPMLAYLVLECILLPIKELLVCITSIVNWFLQRCNLVSKVKPRIVADKLTWRLKLRWT